MQRISGYSEKELIGRSARFLRGERTSEESIRHIDECVKNLEEIDLVEGAIDEYARVVNRIYEFSAIGYALSSLCAFLRSVDAQKMTEIAPKLAMLLEHILDDLSNWRNTIFVAKDTADIHYLDSSLLSSCMQIDAILSEKIASSDDDEDELELF